MEETKKCRECHSDVPVKAKKCPKCQTNLRNWFRRHPVMVLVLLVFVIFMYNSVTSDLDSASTKAIEQETKASETVLGTYTINTDLDELVKGDTPMESVNVFSTVESSPDKLVTKVPNGATVELLERKSDGDVEYDRCKIRYQNQRGWLSCGWLK